MADLMSTGVSALLAFRRALDVTGHNIANVGTDGYSRQRAELVTRGGQGFGDGYVGQGVRVSTVRRLYDEVLALQVRNTASSLSRLEAFAGIAARMSSLFADESSGIAAALQSFVDAVQDVADAPASIPARDVMLSEARALRDRLQYYDARLRDLDAEIDAKLEAEAREVSSLAASIAQLNREISVSLTGGTQPPNDLLDQRDRLLDELAGRVNVSVVAADDGMVNVFVGNGQPLVLGATANRFVTMPDAFDPTRSVLGLATSSGTTEITGSVSGGTLGGLLDVRATLLDPARRELGRMSVALAVAFNDQHHAGIDLEGSLGGDVFAFGGAKTLAHRANTGTATVAARIPQDMQGIAQLTGHDYVLVRTGGAWELRRADDGSVVPTTGTGTAGDPLRAEGLEIEITGAAADGDRFLIRPTLEAVAGFDVLIDDSRHIAAAAPIRTAAAPGNTGTGAISAGEVVDASHPQLRAPVTIEFLDATTYSINGSGSYTLVPGQPIEINGWRVEITGTPAAGDVFTVTSNTGGAGDNRNALALAGVLDRRVLDGGTASLDAAVDSFVGGIGAATRQAQTTRDAQRVVHKDNVAARDAVSGVNLDEEAANLLRYQQAYQAAAQMIQVSQVLFDALLGATARR